MVNARLADRRLRDIWQVIARDGTLSVGAKDRHLKVLRLLDEELPRLNTKVQAEIDLAALQPVLDRLHACLVQVTATEPPDRMDVATTVDQIIDVIRVARMMRADERDALIAGGMMQEGLSTHENVMRFIEAAPKQKGKRAS